MSRPVLNEKGIWVIPPTRRPDGTWRKEVVVKEGYVPQDEIKAFETKATTGPKTIPGLHPPIAPTPQKAKKSQQKLKPVDEGAASKTSSVPPGAIEKPQDKDGVTDPVKRLKSLRKKHREIADLLDKQVEGAALSEDQVGKIARKSEIENEILELEAALASTCKVSSDASWEGPQKVEGEVSPRPQPIVPSNDCQEIQYVVAPNPSFSESDKVANEKQAKALRKKLRQIEELELKRDRGEHCTDDQLEKISKKQEIIQALQSIKAI